MVWYLPWSESIKKRACRYLLQRYLGNFLEEKLTLDQLTVDLYNGTGTVSDVSLDCEALNEVGDSQNWPLEIVDGYMREITVTIPWSTLLKDDSVVEVDGLSLTVQPKVRPEPECGMLESMWSSMSSSLRLAEECLREDAPPAGDAAPVEGVEMFAHAIDSILSRIKVRFINTKIRIEHVPKNSDRGIALEIHIESVEYLDEAGSEPTPDESTPEAPHTYLVATHTHKRIRLRGVTLHSDEFPSTFRTMARSLISERSQTPNEDVNYQSTTSDVFYETRSMISSDIDPVEKVIEETIPQKVKESSPVQSSARPDPILFARLTGVHELGLKMKCGEEVEGPKVQVEVTLGALGVLVTPRQLHTLVELLEALSQPQLEDTSNIPARGHNLGAQCKPMQRADFQLIEAQLLGELGTRAATSHTGWSGPELEDSTCESERFQPFPSSGMADSIASASSLSASVTSSVGVPSVQPRLGRRATHIDGDPTAEVSHVSLRIASLSFVLLHKDILIPSPLGSEYIPPSSAARMQQISSDYFIKLDRFSSGEERRRDINSIIGAIERATERNHVRLVACEIGVAGNEKVTSRCSQTTCEVTVQTLSVQEALYYTHDDDTTPRRHDVLTFRQIEEEESPAAAALRVKYKQVSKSVRVAGERKLQSPNTELSVECGEMDIDVDLTLADRMAATLYGGAASTNSNTTPAAQQPANYSLRCPRVDVILRFPIADLRPGLSREWRRVRDDYLVLRLQHAHVACSRPASVLPQSTTVSVSAHELDLYYHDSCGTAGTHVAHAASDETQTSPAVALPQISITVVPCAPPRGPFDPLSDDDVGFDPPPVSNPMTTSMYILNAVSSAEPSPFSGKKTAHHSRAKHEGSPHGIDEDMIVPGSEEEMAAFTENVSSRSDILVELVMPELSLQLESKQLYEILYNRINSDLLLWEPMTLDHFDISPMAAIHPAFSACRGTGYDSDSGSSSSEEENLYYSTYDARPKTKPFTPAAVAEKRESHDFCLTLKVDKGLLTIYAPVRDSNKRVVPGQMGELVLEANALSLCTASGVNSRGKVAQVCLRAASVTAYHDGLVTIPPEKPGLRKLGSTIPAHLKTTIYPIGRGAVIKDNMQKKDMFTMALKVEPDSDTPNLKSICISVGVEQATLRHRDIAWLSQLLDVLDVVDYPVPGYVPSTVLSELHVHVTDCAVDYRPLYLPIRTLVTLGTFSVSSNIIPATNTSCLRFLAQECTLFLASIPSKPGAPISLDDDKQPDVHKDYVCVLDLALFELSLRMENKDTGSGGAGGGQPVVDVSASNNLVTLHTCWDSATALCRLVTYLACDGDSAPPPPAEGDQTHHDHQYDQETLVGVDDKQLEEIRELSPSEIQQVNDLMAEALKESPNTTLDEDELVSSTEKEGVEIFFFPDESSSKQRQLSDAIDNDETRSIDNEMSLSIDKEERASVDKEDSLSKDSEERLSIDNEDFRPVEQAQEAMPTNMHVVKELGDPTSTPKCSPRKTRRKQNKCSGDGSNTDDEFCIVESHYNEDNELEEPLVNWLGSNPAYMLDNHFTVPCARSDVLKAPKSFPLPVLRYTLCEMSVTWNMFGGTDFKPAADSAKTKKTVTIDEDATHLGSPVNSRSPNEYSPYDTERSVAAAYRTSGVRWSTGADRVTHARKQPRRDLLKTRGGLHRDHDTCVKLCLNKVKFVHETYGAGGAGGVSSRQVLAIAGVEVLDRVQRSHINKLLSHYQRSDEPPRTNAHMLVVKAVHFRGEARVSGAECCLKVSLMPLRFNLDQDTLAFLSQYASKLGSDDNEEEGRGAVTSEGGGAGAGTAGAGGAGSSRQRVPVMSVGAALRDPPPTPTSLGDVDALSLNDSELGNAEPLLENFEAERLVSENLIQLEEDFNRLGMRTPAQPPPQSAPSSEQAEDDEPIYFRRVVFSPEVPIRVDYVGKRVELSAGPVAGLLLGLTQLNCSELTLKRLDYRLGLLGFGRLVQWALREWLADVKRHQLPALLGGIPPLHSLLQLITGIRDLVWLPVEQWRRDGRLVLGLRRGAASFTARTAVAALDITTRLLHLIQATAETALEMVTPARSHTALARSARSRRRDAPPPADIRQGVATAYQTLREGFAEQSARLSSAHGGSGVLRQLPGAAVAPLALAAAGAADLLGGVRASLAPDTARDHRDKWRRP